MTDHPARFVVSAFLAAIVVGAGLLSLPWSTATGRDTDLVTALFMSTSAVCVTGFSTVDVGTHFSGFGQGVLLVLAQVGGLGFMTLASLIAMLVSHRLGLRMALVATAERGTLELGDVRRVLTGVAVVTLVVEVTVALALLVRFRFGYHYPWDDAVWHSVFFQQRRVLPVPGLTEPLRHRHRGHGRGDGRDHGRRSGLPGVGGPLSAKRTRVAEAQPSFPPHLDHVQPVVGGGMGDGVRVGMGQLRDAGVARYSGQGLDGALRFGDGSYRGVSHDDPSGHDR